MLDLGLNSGNIQTKVVDVFELNELLVVCLMLEKIHALIV
jgi:hypothetical protein